jgi:hypothetical protein
MPEEKKTIFQQHIDQLKQIKELQEQHPTKSIMEIYLMIKK